MHTHYFFSIISILWLYGYSVGGILAQSPSVVLSDAFEDIRNQEEVSYAQQLKAFTSLLTAERHAQDSIASGILYGELGKFCYQHHDFKNAIIHNRQALSLLHPYRDSVPTLVNKNYNNLAYFYKQSGDALAALNTFKELTRQSHKDRFTVQAYTIGITNYYMQRGDYFKVLDYLNEAEQMILQSDDPTLYRELYSVYISFSRVLRYTQTVDRYQKVLAYLENAEHAITHLPKEKQLQLQTVIENRYGYVYEELAVYPKAIQHYAKALEIALSLPTPNPNHIATLYNALGYIYVKQGRPQKGVALFRKALAHNPTETAAYDNLGDYYVTQQDMETALQHYQKAIYYNFSDTVPQDYRQLPTGVAIASAVDKAALVNDLKDKANAWYQWYELQGNRDYLQQALQTIIVADQVMDEIHLASYETQTKFFWREKGVDLYTLAVSICYQLKAPDQAFYFMEKSKSLSLLEELTHEQAKKQAALPEQMQEREYQLLQDIQQAKATDTKQDQISAAEQRQNVFEKEKRYESFLDSIASRFPAYYAYRKDIQIADFSAAIAHTKETDTDLIAYIFSDTDGYGIYSTEGVPVFFRIKEMAALQQSLEAYRKLLRKPLQTSQELATYQSLAHTIYRQLFPISISWDTTSTRKLTIIPDQSLQYLPFETLMPIADQTHLIEVAEIHYLYSLSLSHQVAKKQATPAMDAALYAPVTYQNLALPSLQRSKYKAEVLQQQLGATVFMEEQATKQHFITHGGAYQLLHLATHASATPTQQPWIAFSDEKLMLDELFFIKNEAALVVLDACETGVGTLLPGEGVLSLTRGFFQAGAESVISSLWSTNEKSNTSILVDFYTELTAGTSKSSALRNAKVQYLQQHSGSELSPFYWSPLILHGATTPIRFGTDSSPDSYLVYYLLLGILVILVVGYVFFRKRHARYVSRT